MPIIPTWRLPRSMALEGPGRIMRTEASRTMIYVGQKIASDSTFPFKPGDELRIRIDASGKRLIIEKAPARTKSK